MARRRSSTDDSPSPRTPSLTSSRSEVEEKLNARINLGTIIRATDINSEEKLDELRNERSKWDSYNKEFLLRCFDTPSISDEYSNVRGRGAIHMNMTLRELVDGFRGSVKSQLVSLQSILEKLELIPEATNAISVRPETDSPADQDRLSTSEVFIVHGHDEVAKTSVARFIERLNLKAVILHEQPNLGQTIIEKFEANASSAGFAVVLLTPDDVGAPEGQPEDAARRARQNVVLELGYFCGKLGRSRVCVLYKDGVEIPSDYLGVVYTLLDSDDGWQLKLAKEMKAAGLNVDLNKAI